MSVSDLWRRARGYYVRTSSRILFRRPFSIESDVPVISFTFDDFPRSALWEGGDILKQFGLAGTYYASFGLMGKQAPTGDIFEPADLKALLKEGHEVGCHTFGHCHAGDTNADVFEKSIFENRLALTTLVPGATFQSLSYPISQPKAGTKMRVAKHFLCCRGGGQVINNGTADLNCLSAYFLEQSREDFDSIRAIIERARTARGWLIFATHDIAADPTRWGCTPKFFKDVVECSIDSGARILPVSQAYENLRESAQTRRLG